MSKNKNFNNNCRLGTVGGQAVLEGIMMKGKTNYSIAVRREDGSINVSNHTHSSIRNKNKLLRLPIIRGIVGFAESMVLNFKTLSKSAEMSGTLDDVEPETKFEKWLTNKLGDKLMGIIMAISMVVGVALSIGLFMLLPSYTVKGIEYLVGVKLGLFKNVIEGIIKIAIFIGYILLVSLMKDIRRTFEYHGAEHKSIFCYESGEELTVENVRKHGRFHPRCGTSFIFVVLIISIFINSLPFISWTNMALRLVAKLLMLPLIVGISFEFIIFAGKHDNIVTKILSFPGLLMQRITTKEPDDSQIEVAIVALKNALPDEFPEVLNTEADKQDESTGNEVNE